MRNIVLALFCLICFPLLAQDPTYAVGYKEKGMASFYDKSFHGKTTASGEQYDMFGYTAAHRTIPFNSIIKVTNVQNGKWITLRINDRGPLSASRILDVSKRAALKLDLVKDEEVEVEIEILKLGDNKVVAAAGVAEDGSKPEATTTAPATEQPKPTESVATAPATATPAPTAAQPVATQPVTAQPSAAQPVAAQPNAAQPKTEPATATKPAATTTAAPTTTTTAPKTTTRGNPDQPAASPGRVAAQNAPKPEANNVPLNERFKKTGTYNTWGTPVTPSGYGIQLGTYKDIDTALKICGEAKKLGFGEVYVQSGWTQGVQNFRVVYASEEDPEKLRTSLDSVKKKGYPDAFIRKHFE